MAFDKQELLALRNDPNIQTMLNLLSRTEGTHGATNPYAVYGGKVSNQLSSLALHPGQAGAWQFKWNNGKQDKSTASGRYQIIEATWNDVAKKYGLSDFSPINQDLAAIALMKEKGAIQDIKNGNFHAAARKLGSTWASLPTSTHDQAKRSPAEFNKMLAASGGGLPTSFTQPRTSQPNNVPTTVTTPIFAAQPKLASNTDKATLLSPTDSAVFALVPELSKEELAAIIPAQIIQPKVLDKFFTEPIKVDWDSYYN